MGGFEGGCVKRVGGGGGGGGGGGRGAGCDVLRQAVDEQFGDGVDELEERCVAESEGAH
jgi:hypothetical protein